MFDVNALGDSKVICRSHRCSSSTTGLTVLLESPFGDAYQLILRMNAHRGFLALYFAHRVEDLEFERETCKSLVELLVLI